MFGAFLDSINSTVSLTEALEQSQDVLSNAYTPGYQQSRPKLAFSDFGVLLGEPEKVDSGNSLIFYRGEKVTKLAIDRDFPQVHFLVRNGKSEYLTRLGDFTYTRRQRSSETYIGQPLEERTYLSTREGFPVLGYPVGRGPYKQEKRYKDPLSTSDPVILGESPIQNPAKDIGKNEPLQLGPLVPIDLTRGANGLYLDRYEKLETNKEGIIMGLRKGLWVPLYQVAMVSVPNPAGLARVDNTAYRLENENSGLRQAAPNNVRVRAENLEKSNINVKLASFDYKKLRTNLSLAFNLQKSNAQLMQQFSQLLQG